METKVLSLDVLKKSNNIAKLLPESQLHAIGQQVKRGYEIDEESRSEWKRNVCEALDIAKQVMERKDFPWENASNIKYPLITQASIDYASRTMPEVIQNDKVVKARVNGKDPDDLKYRRASRVSDYMSYQLVCESPDWEDGLDKLLQVLPIMGTVFKKTYYDEVEKRNCSDLCVPDKIVINYNTQSLDTARRITHVLDLYSNDIMTYQQAGLYLDVDIESLERSRDSNSQDEDPEICFLEQHCYLDLDGDKYKEPYIVTVHKESGQVLRIVSRFKDIQKTKDGKVLKIEADQYFTDFHFIRSPDGGFYSIGFGTLLLPINKSINTLINQLIDSGTLNNTQGGLIGKGLRLKNGTIQFKMGQWQYVDTAIGEDIAKNIYQWPTKEPSQTLFALLQLLMQVGKDLSSTTDVLQGNQPAQNVASSTISQLVEQGTKVFVAINKRLYRSLKKEYYKLYYLNYKYLKNSDYVRYLDDQEADVKKDFSLEDLDIFPVADPTVTTESQRIVRAGMVQQLRTADPREADRLLLQAMQMDTETIDRLLPPVDPNAPPPPEQQKVMAEAQKLQVEAANMAAETKLSSEKNQMDLHKLLQDIKESEARINEAAARVWKMQQDALNNMNKTKITATKMSSEQELKGVNLANEVDVKQAELVLRAKELTQKDKEIAIKGATTDGTSV